MMTFEKNPATLQKEGIIHKEDHGKNRKRLEGLYGKVAERQNQLIISSIEGQLILDVGAGYGNLSRQIMEEGRDVIPIEIDKKKIEKAREWFDIEIMHEDYYNWDGGEVDTVIFRETLNHLDMEKALARAYEITKHQVIVFQGSEILPLRLAKKLFRHREFQLKTPKDIVQGLKKAGFRIRKIIYSDVLAYPLSGGWQGICLVPASVILEKAINKAEPMAEKLVKSLGLQEYFCYRVLIDAVTT